MLHPYLGLKSYLLFYELFFITTYAIQLQQNLHHAGTLPKQHIVAAQECQKFYYDRNAFLPSSIWDSMYCTTLAPC